MRTETVSLNNKGEEVKLRRYKTECWSICGFGSLFLLLLYYMIQSSGINFDIQAECQQPNAFIYEPGDLPGTFETSDFNN